MNEKTAEMLRFFLAILAERGEDEMFVELKKYVRQSKKKAKK
jgi:hypothetical protein